MGNNYYAKEKENNMSNKVTLIYEDGKYSVFINEAIVSTDKDIDRSIEKFKQVVDNNSITQLNSWDNMEIRLKAFKDSRLQINSEFKTISFGVLKYFYSNGKVFYMGNGQMVPLIGGIDFLYFILTMVTEGKIIDSDYFVEFCKVVLEKRGTYRTSESTITVLSGAFNYGSAEYNFSNGKINKGVSIDIGTFEDFKSYVSNIIKV